MLVAGACDAVWTQVGSAWKIKEDKITAAPKESE